MRHVCTAAQCDFVAWNNPTPVVAALVRHQDHYILARNVRWPTGVFSVITGYLEANETLEQAVVREVQEELGLKGVIRHYLGNYVFREKNQLILAFEVLATGKLQTNHELAEIKKVSTHQLKVMDFSPLYITTQIIHDWSHRHP